MQLVVPLYAMSLQASTAQIGLIRGISGLGMLLLVIPLFFLLVILAYRTDMQSEQEIRVVPVKGVVTE